MTGPVLLDKKTPCVGHGSRNIFNKQQDSRGIRTGEAETANTTTQQSRLPSVTTKEQSGGRQVSPLPDVGSVVSKAKRAAQSLWILIHAQNCRIGGNRCPHAGCTEAKKVLLHLKTCPAAAGSDCPIHFNGCYQSRKLLGHYQRCRELRAKQAGMGRRGKSQQHVCLVCSLVARQARNLLEGGRTSKRTGGSRKQVIASFTLNRNGVAGSVAVGDNGTSMPPPPPRQTSATSSPIPMKNAGYREESKMVESPPSQNHLMLFSEVAAAAAPPALVAATEPEVLGKSLDSSRSTFLTFAANALHSMKSKPPPIASRRARAESFDERAVKPRRRTNGIQADSGNDPTLELELQRDPESSSELADGERPGLRRERSASLGVLASCCVARKGAGCDPIAEEGGSQAVGEHEDIFEMDEAH